MIVLGLLATPAGATTVVNDRTDWLAQTSDVLTITFEDLAPDSAPWFADYGTAAGVTLSDVNFISVGGEAYNLTIWNPAGNGNWNSGDYARGGYSPGYILATLPGCGSYAVGFDLMTLSLVRDVTVTLSGVESYVVPTSAIPNRTFIGFISETPITSVAFSASNTYTQIDNFSYSVAAEAPEPDTIFLGAIGLAGLWLGKLVRRRAR